MIEFVTATKERVSDRARFAREHVGGDHMYPYAVFHNNKQGLPACYNEYVRQRRAHILIVGDIAVFMHDDVRVEDALFRDKLMEAMEHFDVVGVAGTSDFIITEHSMWHHTPVQARSGAVTHPDYGDLQEDPTNTVPKMYDGVDMCGVASFGPMPKRCVVLDGLFLAVNLEKVFVEAGILFDTQFDFHFYDLDFCLRCHNVGLRLGTWPIHVVHESPGLRSFEDPDFIRNRDNFKDKWGPEGMRYVCNQTVS